MATQVPRPNQQSREAEVVVGNTIPDEELRQMVGEFGDVDDIDDDENGQTGERPDEVALLKTRTWGSGS